MQPIIGRAGHIMPGKDKSEGLESDMPRCGAEVSHIIHLLFYYLRVTYRLQQEKCLLHFSLFPGKWLIVFLDTPALLIQ